MSCIFVLAACSSSPDSSSQMDAISYLESPAQGVSGEPFLFTLQDSIVYLSWIEKEGEESAFKFSSRRNGRWDSPSTIATGDTWFVNWADYPMIVGNGNEFIAHFLEMNGESDYAYDVKLTSSADRGTTWSTPAVLHDDGRQAEHGFVSMVPYNENFFITWLDGRNSVMDEMKDPGDHNGHGGAMSLRAAILDSKGYKIEEWELDTRTCDCCQTSAAITSNGPVVVYRDRSDEEIRDISIVRLINGQWTKPETIHRDNWKIAGCPVNGPRVVAVANDIAVVWFTAASDVAQVNVVFSNDGGATFGKSIRVDEGSPIGRVDIVMLEDSRAVVSWMEGIEIKVAKVSSDGTKEPSITIGASSDSRSSGFPQMTRSGTKLILAWTDDKEKSIKLASINSHVLGKIGILTTH